MAGPSRSPQLWRVASHPLLHFVLIGAALFAIYGWRNGFEARGSTSIDVDRGQIAWLAGTFATQFGHRPNRRELDSLVQAYVADEMSYREAMAMGLDQDDSIVRRRLIQKYEFTDLEEQPAAPPDATLRAFFAGHRQRYAEPAFVSLCQVYVTAVPDRAAALRRSRDLAAALQDGRVEPDGAGDPIDLPACVARTSRADLQRTFGSFFASTAQKLPLGRWIAPVESGYGLHAVKVSERVAAPARLDDWRAEVLADWTAAEQARLRAERLARLRARYRVSIDGAAMDAVAAATR